MRFIDYVFSEDADPATIETMAAFQSFLRRDIEPEQMTILDLLRLSPAERDLVMPGYRDCDQPCDYAEGS